MMNVLRVCVVCLLAVVGASSVRAQCTPGWQPFDPTTASIPGVNGQVFATTMWDPDGPGPQTPRLVIGGSFTVAGNTLANRIALYDPATGAWSALGTGMNNRVNALTTLPSGDLIAGGDFTFAGGVTVNRIARWNGSAWSALGTGMSGGSFAAVNALTTLPSGDLIAGGQFSTAGGVTVNGVARWNGAAWSALGTGTSGGSLPNVRALTALPSGDLIAGGEFTTAGGVTVNGIARWNGSAWLALGAGMSGFSSVGVYALTTLPSGDLIAGGFFTSAGGVPANFIARWNGSAWSALGTGMSSTVTALTALPSGDLIAGGNFTTAGGVPANRIARWNGSAWSALGTGMSGGNFSVPPIVKALTTLPSGDLIAGGDFITAGGVTLNCIARWNGSAWSALGTGMSGGSSNPVVFALTTLPSGDLIAGGSFTTAGGVTVNRIARWNGSAWSALGTGMNSDMYAVTTLPSGDLIAGGVFTTAGGVPVNRIARWNGSVWSALGSGMSNTVTALTALPSGDLIAGGFFTSAGGRTVNGIAGWNGSAWSALGTGMSGGSLPNVRALTTLPSGDLIAGGEFTTAGGVTVNGIARWNGSAWSALGPGMNGPVFVLDRLPSGDLIAGGSFTTAGGVTVNNIARWNGSAWSALGAGMNSIVLALTTLPNGDLIAGGVFTTAGLGVAPYIARWPNCPLPPVCVADIVAIGGLPPGDGLLTGDDFNAFVAAFAANDGLADIVSIGGEPPPDGLVTGDDFVAFIAGFAAGCP